MLASKLRGDFHLVSANVVNHARLTWVHGMLGAMLVRCLLGHAPRLSTILGICYRPACLRSLCLMASTSPCWFVTQYHRLPCSDWQAT